MWQFLQRSLTTVFILLIVGGITFGASQAFGANQLSSDWCGKYEGDLGCCPPITGYTCWEECTDLGYQGGDCLRMDRPDKNGCTECCSCLW